MLLLLALLLVALLLTIASCLLSLVALLLLAICCGLGVVTLVVARRLAVRIVTDGDEREKKRTCSNVPITVNVTTFLSKGGVHVPLWGSGGSLLAIARVR